MRLAVIGSRTFCDESDYETIKYVLDKITGITEIVSGGANGADKLGERYAYEKGLLLKVFLPDWDNHGKAAGPIRNALIAKYADRGAAFWNGKSTGTLDCIKRFQKMGKEISIFQYKTI